MPFIIVHEVVCSSLAFFLQAEQTEQAKEMGKVLQQNYLRMKASSEKHIGRLSRQVEVGNPFIHKVTLPNAKMRSDGLSFMRLACPEEFYKGSGIM